METALNETERRVLGVLMEKALAQPDYYPMTVNAIVAASNQKSNRHPMMNLEEVEVLRTLEGLRRRGLVSMVLAAPGARVNRYKHEAEKALDWNKRQQAIMAELLLRGPQTPGELRSRCARMFPLESMEAMMIALASLGQRDSGPAVVAAMPREPGQSATRYTHLLYPEGEAPAPAPPSAIPPAVSAKPQAVASVPRSAPAPASASGEPWAGGAKPQAAPSAPASAPVTLSAPNANVEVEALRAEIDGLNTELAELHEELAELRRRIETIEAKTSGL